MISICLVSCSRLLISPVAVLVLDADKYARRVLAAVAEDFGISRRVPRSHFRRGRVGAEKRQQVWRFTEKNQERLHFLLTSVQTRSRTEKMQLEKSITMCLWTGTYFCLTARGWSGSSSRTATSPSSRRLSSRLGSAPASWRDHPTARTLITCESCCSFELQFFIHLPVPEVFKTAACPSGNKSWKNSTSVQPQFCCWHGVAIPVSYDLKKRGLSWSGRRSTSQWTAVHWNAARKGHSRVPSASATFMSPSSSFASGPAQRASCSWWSCPADAAHPDPGPGHQGAVQSALTPSLLFSFISGRLELEPEALNWPDRGVWVICNLDAIMRLVSKVGPVSSLSLEFLKHNQVNRCTWLLWNRRTSRFSLGRRAGSFHSVLGCTPVIMSVLPKAPHKWSSLKLKSQ